MSFGVANAGTFTYAGYGFSGENVHLSDAAMYVNNEYGGSGLITLNGPSSLAVYCVDIAAWLLNAGTYNSGVDPLSNPNLTGASSFTGHDKIADIAALIANGSNVAAVQLAIWEIEYAAAASFRPDDSGLQAVASFYLANLNAGTGQWVNSTGLFLNELTPANGVVNQSMVYLASTPPPTPQPGGVEVTTQSSVPEPAAITVLGFGMLMLGWVRARHRGAVTAQA